MPRFITSPRMGRPMTLRHHNSQAEMWFPLSRRRRVWGERSPWTSRRMCGSNG